MNSSINLSLTYTRYGGCNSPATLTYSALAAEQERLITLLAQNHADQHYEDAVQTEEQIELISGQMGAIVHQLANECERLSLELLKVQNPTSYKSVMKTYKDHGQRRMGLYDERFYDKPYKGIEDKEGPEFTSQQ